MANTSICFCRKFAYTSTIYAQPCVLINGRGASFYGGSVGAQIQNQSAPLAATLFAGGIYA